MKRVVRVWAVLAVVAASVLGSHTAAHATVDDFRYDSWHVEYQISTDSGGGALATVTETVVAQFPSFDQNRGIVRALPLTFEGAPAAPENISVTDENGGPVPFWTEEDDTFRAIMVGDDSFVHGEQTYVISYTLKNVIFTVDAGTHDEFYWDIVPSERRQPIDDFTGTLAFAPELAAQLTGEAACYTGKAYEDTRCTITPAAGDDAAFEVGPLALDPLEGVTVATGLNLGSVVQPSERLPNPLLDWGPLVFGILAIAVAGAAGAMQIRSYLRHRRATGIIVAQYDVPSHLPPLIASPIVGGTKSVIAAEFVHLAVNGAVRIEDGEPSGGFLSSRKPRPVLRSLDTSQAAAEFDDLDLKTLKALFGANAPGTAFTVPSSSEAFGQKMRKLIAAGSAQAKKRGYTVSQRAKSAPVLSLVAIGLVAVTIVLSVLGMSRESALPVAGFPLGFVALILSIFGLIRFPMHTPNGAETREYLLGVREFIRVAEADRIRMLQSYSGAERKADGSVDVVVLYEKLLPYAVLFGLEKEWGKVLEVAYHDNGISAPIWYPGLAVAGLSSLHSTLDSFTSTLTSSASYTSSSSGGSSGGGFSGGGGGGGFSGGR